MKHLKRTIAVSAILGLLIPGQALVTGKAFASNQINVEMVSYPVTFDGTVIDNAHNRYPLLSYKDITYVPMTWDYGHALGLNTNWTAETGLDVQQEPGLKDALKQDLSVTNNLNKTYSAEIASFPVTVNGKMIDQQQEEYPLLTFRDITYFPMTWRFAHDQFNWGYNWDAAAGFSIATQQQKMLSGIVGDDANSLYVQSGYGLLKFNKSLSEQPAKASQEEVQTYMSKVPENTVARLNAVVFHGDKDTIATKQEGDSVKWGDKEILSLTSYKENDAKYYAEHPEYAKQNIGVHYFEQVMKVNEKMSLLVLTVFHMNHIPAPYTPHDFYVFVKNGDTITKVENNNQFPDYVMTNADGSFWLHTVTPAFVTVRNGDVRGTLTLVDPNGQGHSFNQTLGASDIDVLQNTEGTLAVHAYNDRFGDGVKDSDGYYVIGSNQKVKKLFDGGSGQAYIDSIGDIYVVDQKENRITDVSKNVAGFWWDRDLSAFRPE